MIIKSIRCKLYKWTGPVVTANTLFTNPMSALPFQKDSQSTFRFFSWLVVEVESEDGIIGLGNAGLCPDICKEIIEKKLSAILIGENITNSDYLFQKMYRSTIAYGRKGAVMAAISAIDIALWDIKGQVWQQPIFKLIGGRCKDTITCYYSRLYDHHLDALAAEAQEAKDAGFSSMKMRLAYSMQEGRQGMRKNVEMVKTVRDVIGDDCDLVLETYMGFNYSYAKQLFRLLEPYNLRWVEEPLIPDEYHLMAKLRSEVSVPVSSGEHEFSRYGCAELIRSGAVDVIQFDTNRVGGFTEAQKICTLAEAEGIDVIPHGGQMHNAHVVMSSFAAPMLEYFPKSHIEVGNEIFWYMFDGECVAENGQVNIDDSIHGLGLTLSQDPENLKNFEITE